MYDRIRQLEERFTAPSRRFPWNGPCCQSAYQQYGRDLFHSPRQKAHYLMAHRTSIWDGARHRRRKGAGETPAAPTFRNCAAILLEDFDTLNSRERVFRVTDEDKRIQRDVIIPYWKDWARLTKMNGLPPRAWQNYLPPVCSRNLAAAAGPYRGRWHDILKGYGDFPADQNARQPRISITIWMPRKTGRMGRHGLGLPGHDPLGNAMPPARDMAAKRKRPASRRWDLLDIAAVRDVVPNTGASRRSWLCTEMQRWVHPYRRGRRK